ncbi:MarR family winged helix-turn-helix transcriptional regulator [Pseudomonas typographi]|uniref:MarR family transcriptional regulator n=1 Tax=Pseudomonas typographi TaxID=2715964 RepID=A0ABR7Z545_9PSED|nr:MarR family transcriptional regulator [Pseudomonas typographi]MBD1552839.1 MarR family transcriptional regulator [Pseudomonas typographi]MBD1600598.1 MarR family transcriptional regulator [Pseudomonas typographi]
MLDTPHPHRGTALSPSNHQTSQHAVSRAEQVAEGLRRVVGDLVRKVRNEAHTPSSAQSETLGFIDRNGAASISEVAAYRHVKHQSMRLVIDQLELQALVTRTPDPVDGRKQLIELTAKGKAALETGRSQRSQWLADELKHKTNAAELETLSCAVEILGRLLAAEQNDQSV